MQFTKDIWKSLPNEYRNEELNCNYICNYIYVFCWPTRPRPIVGHYFRPWCLLVQSVLCLSLKQNHTGGSNVKKFAYSILKVSCEYLFAGWCQDGDGRGLTHGGHGAVLWRVVGRHAEAVGGRWGSRMLLAFQWVSAKRLCEIVSWNN